MYTIIYSFMSRELGLKGAEKEVFAVIFGFWRRTMSPVGVSNSVIKMITGFTRATIIAAKNKLIEDGLIKAQETRGKPSQYEVILPPGLKIDPSEYLTSRKNKKRGSENQTGPLSGQKNNYNTNKNIKNKRNGNQSINVGSREEFEGGDRI